MKKYKLECAVKFAMNRKGFIDTCTGAEKKALQNSYNKVLLDIKELLQLNDALEILDITYDNITVPEQYKDNVKKLFPNNRIEVIKNNLKLFIK